MDDRRRHLAPSQPESCGVAGRGGDRGQTRPYPWTPFGRASGLRARASGGASVGSPRCARMATITSLSEISATIASARTATPECAPFEWAQLLRRIHGVDVLPCPYSGRRAIVRGLHRASLPSVHSADSVRASIPREVTDRTHRHVFDFVRESWIHRQSTTTPAPHEMCNVVAHD
jgi:hypothetical protein